MSWIEKDFEKWFIKNKKIKLNGKTVKFDFVVRAEKGRRLVDLICLDRKGHLLVIEVKNELTGRSGIGQLLEYVSQMHGATVEDIEHHFQHKYQHAWLAKKPTKLKSSFTGVIAAKDFNREAIASVQFLTKKLAGDINLKAFKINGTKNNFRLEEVTDQFRDYSKFKLNSYGISKNNGIYVVTTVAKKKVAVRIGRLALIKKNPSIENIKLSRQFKITRGRKQLLPFALKEKITLRNANKVYAVNRAGHFVILFEIGRWIFNQRYYEGQPSVENGTNLRRTWAHKTRLKNTAKTNYKAKIT